MLSAQRKNRDVNTAKFCERYNQISNPDNEASVSMETHWATNISHSENQKSKSDLDLDSPSAKETVKQNLHVIAKDSSKESRHLTPLIPQKRIQKNSLKGVFQHQINKYAQHLACAGAQKYIKKNSINHFNSSGKIKEKNITENKGNSQPPQI